MPRKKKPAEEKPPEKEEGKEVSLVDAMQEMMNAEPDVRTMMLYGEINEEKIQDLVGENI